MRLDLADLQLFICIVEAGSITGGAIKAHLALASASERLRHMEEDVGVALLVRHARGVTLTQAGEALARHARQILLQQQLLKSELRTFSAGVRGTLKLYANTSALTHFLPGRIAPWLALHPDLHIELEERSSRDIISSLLAGLGEAGIVSDAVDRQGLTLEPVADDRLTLIIPAAHALNTQQSVFFHDILEEPFIGLYSGSALQQHIDSHASALGKTLNVRIRMNTFEGVSEMVAQGTGLGIIPETLAEKYQGRFGYNSVALRDSWAQRKLCLCFRHWQDLTPAMKHLFAHLRGATDAVSGEAHLR